MPTAPAQASATRPGLAVSFRIPGRLSQTYPDIARFLTGTGLDLLDALTGAGTRITALAAAGRSEGPQPL